MFVSGKLFHKVGDNSGGGGGGGDQHNLGWYATSSDLQTAHPTASAGDWAIVGATDTVWVWDTDTSAWVDTDTKGQVTSVNGATGAVTIGANDVLPTQTGHSGHVLGTDGFVAGWVEPEIVQRSALPVASQDEEGNIYQFVGTTDANYTNGYFYKCVSDGQTPATYSWEQTDVMPAGSSLPSQTGHSGEFLTTDGTDASWGNALQNSATGSHSMIIGDATMATSTSDAVLIGFNARSYGNGAVKVGAYGLDRGNHNTSIGDYHDVNLNIYGTINLGYGITATESQTLNVRFAGNTGSTGQTAQYKLLDSDGTIPTARLTKVNTTVTLTTAGWSGGSQTVTVTGVTSTSVVLVAPDPSDTADYVAAGILCTSQTTDSLTFTATTTPTNDIDVNIVCL